MPEQIKQCAENVAKTINGIPASNREIIARLAETFATGLAAGMELAEENKAAQAAEEVEVNGHAG